MKKFFLSLLFCLMSFSVYANERILNFNSLLDVQKNGDIIVTETLLVQHEGWKIKRGIFRDLPAGKGEEYELISVRRNGIKEPAFVERPTGYYRINTGDNSFLPAPATSEFEICYRVKNVPRSFKGYDEVYWNATGAWEFPIDKVKVEIYLPAGAEILQQASYIGQSKSKTPAQYLGHGVWTWGQLFPGQQLTISAGFTPDIVKTTFPLPIDRKTGFLSLLFVCVFAYLYWVWNKHGRDPEGRVIMPQFDSPEGLTAAQSLTLLNSGIITDDSILANISIMQMIQRQFLKVEKEKKTTLLIFNKDIYLLKRTGKDPINEEERLYSQIFGKTLILDGVQKVSLEKYCSIIDRKSKESIKKYYQSNSKKIFPLCVSFLYLLIFLGLVDWKIFLSNVWFVVLPFFIASSICNIRKRTTSFIVSFILFFVTFLLMIVPPGEEKYMSDILPCDFVNAFLSASTAALFPIFSYLIYQPTEKGQRLYEHMLGLKMFIKATHRRTSEEALLSKEKMEELFPYAMALGLEKEWENKFIRLFGKKQLDFYVSSHSYLNRSFRRSFISSVSSSTHRSSGKAGGHSGSFRGGFSGGGFGGGRGGGR